MKLRDALSGANRAAFQKELKNLADRRHRDRGTLHAIGQDFAVGALASQAAKALRAIPVLTELGAFDLASIALHKRSIQQPVRVVKTPPANTGYFHSLTRHLVKIV